MESTNSMKQYNARLFMFIILGLSAGGKETAPDLTPDEIVQNSVARMQNMPGFSFLIDRDGAPAFLDAELTISFSRAEGKFNSPDAVTAKVKVVIPGIVAEVETIGIGDFQWQTNLLSRQWEVVESGDGFNPSVLFHPETGVNKLLANDLSELELVGMVELEEVPGKELYLLIASMKGHNAFELTFGLIGPDQLDVRLWISPDTFELYRIEVIEPGVDGGEDTIWLLDFWDYDQVVDIQSPLP